MSDRGRIEGLTTILKHLLHRLNSKGVLSPDETVDLFDEALDEIKGRSDLPPSERADAAKEIGALGLPRFDQVGQQRT